MYIPHRQVRQKPGSTPRQLSEVGFCYQVMRHRKLSLRTVLSLGSIPAPHLSLLILNLS
jgi:hypothetical protein